MRTMLSLALVLFCSVSVAQEAWRPAEGPLVTPWAEDVSPESVHDEYPRPQMVRPEWTNLNGLWHYAIRPRGEDRPEMWDGRILVPFPVESALSGVKKQVGAENRLWYRRTFPAARPADEGRLLLHFGAVDWRCEVWVNGQPAGEHQGGYDAFTFDITDLLRDDEQELVVAVWDPTDQGYQPRGKQVVEPRGIWYTPVTGIWQTVWLETVPAASISSYTLAPDVDRGSATFHVNTAQSQIADEAAIARVRVLLPATDDKPRRDAVDSYGAPGEPIVVKLPADPAIRLWSPDSPYLYDVEITLHKRVADKANNAGEQLDKVTGYFGMRKISLGKDVDGLVRLMLNNEPLFQFGTLDQGWWPDGLYTAPTDEALLFDIEMTKKLGFNMIRKHVKVEPARWYYHCDQLGLLVWQDMPNGDRHIGRDDRDIVRSPESAENFRREWREIMDENRNHPSIVVWVPFNEGWGQFATEKILAWTKQHDPTRLVDGPSGWTDRGVGEMHDMHRYPGPAMPEPESDRAVVLGEFGGLGLPLEGHLWWNKRNWGYRTYKTRDELWSNYRRLIRELHPLIGRGLAAAIYTQTTDVEGEVNGLMTYDRRVVKFDPEKMTALHARLHEPPPILETTTVVPTSEKQGEMWRYTTTRPAENWAAPGFDDSSWREGEGGFGEPTTPGSAVRTRWKTGDIWLRRAVQIPAGALTQPHLRIHHDEDAEVYVNGRPVASLTGYVTEYIQYELDDKAREAFKEGANVIAIHCKQTGGGQYIDAGIVNVVEKPEE
ncbi:MAG: beta-galactosidase [Planctomycetes bacterium]|nr:beta-galactosidase [Planctomycetota bacterium]